MIKVPPSEVATRIVSFQHFLLERGVDAAIIRQNADLYYFTGTVQDGYLFVPSVGEPLFCVRRQIERAMEQSPLRPLIPIRTPREIPNILLDHGYEDLVKIGLELDVMPASTYFFFKDNLFPRVEIVDVSMVIRQVRVIKSEWEIDMMKKAAVISHKVAEAVPEFLKEGITQLDLSIELEKVARKNGHLGLIRIRGWNMDMYFGHVLAGPDAAVPSYADAPTGGVGISPAFGQGPSVSPITAGQVVSIDTMMNFEGYLSDQTRNFCIGNPPRRLADAYEVVKEIHEEFKENAKPGAVTGELYEMVVNRVAKHNLQDYFLGSPGNQVKFVGHGLGIEVDEFPFIAKGQRMPLGAGMTVAFEPKFIFPDLGIVGLENTYLITDEGAVSLNTFPEELMIL